MARFGEYLGMAFQIVDDLLDFTESATVTGKPSGNDLREHKVTLPLIHALPQMNDAQRARVQRLMETEAPPDGLIEEVVADVAERGGLAYARERAHRFARRPKPSWRSCRIPVPRDPAGQPHLRPRPEKVDARQSPTAPLLRM
jgi:octaprenyl-diphosphate synthase